MCIQDINFRFGNGKDGYCIKLLDTSQDPMSIRLLLIWTEVLHGGISGIQVWRKGYVYRDVSMAFHNARHNPDNMNKSIGNYVMKSMEIAYNCSTLCVSSIDLHQHNSSYLRVNTLVSSRYMNQ